MSLRVGLLHGAGYTGRELIRLVLGHPSLSLTQVTSRTFAGQPLWHAHPDLRGSTDVAFSEPDQVDSGALDAAFVAAEHGQGAVTCKALIDGGFDGFVVDLSADFRLKDPGDYERRYGRVHPAPELAGAFRYGMADLASPYEEGTRRIANPGCFATGLALALAPIAPVSAAVTAMTGASGSGARPGPGTHFPDREGNVRAYKIFEHQHLPEVMQVVGPGSEVDFVPVSGPWTRGIWGTVVARGTRDVGSAFQSAYGNRPLVRLWPGKLPELRWSVGTPFCDIGWVQKGDSLVVGFSLDNLLKGAASQAVHNLNLMAGLEEAAGLL